MALPVIDDRDFVGADNGLAVPERHLADGTFGLQITGLDRADPPQYRPGGMPRTLTFNGNLLALTSDPAMPTIEVHCDLTGFEPSPATPLYWRLQTRHIPARFFNRGSSHYVSKVAVLDGEWTGSALSSRFDLFAAGATPPGLTYDNRDDRVAGGHAILTVAARPDPSRSWLQDFVHLRLTGANPTTADIRRYVAAIVAGRHAPSFENMLNAIFAWEASGQQFSPSRQTQTHFKTVLFDWPDDPQNFPVAAFDFGVGISQFTAPQKLKTQHAWDWRANLAIGANVFFEKLARVYTPGIHWRAWALAAWKAYNGSGAAADAYAVARSKSPDGAGVPDTAVPPAFDLAAATRAIDFATPPPGRWPVTKVLAAQITTAALAADGTRLAAEAIAASASQVAGDRDTLAWMWPRVTDDLHAQSDHAATHVMPGLNGADVAAAVAGLGKSGIDHLANAAFSLAWNKLAPSTPALAMAAPIDQEFQTLAPFVRQHIGSHGSVAEWASIRSLMLEAFGASADPKLAISRINAYYGAFVSAQLQAGGVSMKVHAAMKTRMDAAQSLLAAKGAAAKLAEVDDIGGFDIRTNANNSKALSNHSFGIAIDLDAALNPNMAMKPANLAAWTDLVEFLTGVAPYGAESTRLRTPRSYDQSLPDVKILKAASAAYVTANSGRAGMAAAVQVGFQRRFQLAITTADAAELLSLASPPHPNPASISTRLGSLGVAAAALSDMTNRLIFAQQVFFLAQDKNLKPAVGGTAVTTAKFGFVNLPAEVIAGLISSDGGKLRWLGTSNSTKDYMHFDFPDGQHPPLF